MIENNTTAPDEMKKVLEAYNTIREYCLNKCNCDNCPFPDEADMCNIGSDIPENWPKLDLD